MTKSTLLLLALMVVAASGQEPVAGDRFYQAIRNNDLTALRALVKTQGTATPDRTGHTPLILAAAFGSVEGMQLLLDAGADVKAANDAGVTALHVATGDVRKVRLLLDRGADANARSMIGRTPLIVAASTSGAVDVVRLLLAQGADFNAADSTGVTALIAATSVGDAAVARLLLDRGADVNPRANVGQSATALMGAAYNGNVELVRLILARKPDVNVASADRSGLVKNGPVLFGNVTALHMATSNGSLDVVQLLLAAGAAVDAKDVRGMTPLMWAVATDRPEPRIVRLLLEQGAKTDIRSNLAESAIDWAKKFNNPPVLALLHLSPESAAAAALSAQGVAPISSHEAIERSLPLMRRASTSVLTDGGCVACHAQPMTSIAAEQALSGGLKVERMATDLAVAGGSLTSSAHINLQAREGGGAPDTQVYTTMMLAAAGTPPSLGTDAVVHYLAAKQRREGNWHGVGATRAPMQDGDFSRTAMAIRALTVYGMPARETEITERIARAATWLGVQTPITTEDRVMQLLGLTWAGVNDRVTEARTRELLGAQRADGGWAQTPHLASDAYATGQALYVLRQLGIPTADPAIQRGTAFLLRTQHEDGSWFVKSRAMKIQPYFESGFPHGHDQWISQTATAWAVMALSATQPPAPTSAAR